MRRATRLYVALFLTFTPVLAGVATQASVAVRCQVVAGSTSCLVWK